MVLILTYAVFLLLILRFCMVLFNFTSNPKLPPAPRNYYDFVSIMVASYQDLSQLTGLLQSIREQDFENYEVLIHDNGSPELKKVVALATGRNSRFRVLEPPGGGGDQNVCAQMSEAAKGDYFLFLNGVERIEEGLLYSALYRMKIHSLGVLSLFVNQKMKTFAEGMMIPPISYLLISLLPLRLTLMTRWKWMVAAGAQFQLFNAQHYRTFKWHASGKASATGQWQLMKKMKALGFRVESLFAQGYVSGRMYAGEQDFGNFRDDLTAGFGGNALLLLTYLLCCTAGLTLLLPLLSMQLLGMALTLIAGMRVMSSLLSGQPVWWNLLFHPLQMAVLAAAIAASLYRILRKNG